MLYKHTVGILFLVLLTACQVNQPLQTDKTSTAPSDQQNSATTADGIKITPYQRDEIKREQIVLPAQKPSKQSFDDGRNLAAYKQLMQNTHNAFKQAKWDEAEKNALNAQRIAPQSAEVFMYLALIANHKNQAANAESLARRGLSYAQSDAMKRQLWSIILKSAQIQKKPKIIQEAERSLKTL